MTQLVFTERRHTDSEKWHKYPEDVIPAWVADADYMAAEPILQALRARVEEGVFGYTTPPPQLLETACAYFKRRWNWDVQPEWILLSPGLGSAIHNSCRMAGGRGILTPQPIYHVFRTAPEIAGAWRSDTQMAYDHFNHRWLLSVQSLKSAAAAVPKNELTVFQLCNPHNPNGKVFTHEELFSIGDFCCSHDMLIFSDEVHADLLLDEDAPHVPMASLSPEIAERTITLQSPSKAYNIAGLNLAFVIISNPALRARYQKAAAGKVIAHLNPFGYAAAQAAYSGDCDDWLAAQTAHLRQQRQVLHEFVDDLECIYMPHLQATYLAWLDVHELHLPDPYAHFLAHGLGLSAGKSFGEPQYLRLNFACSPERLQEMTKRLEAAVSAAV